MDQAFILLLYFGKGHSTLGEDYCFSWANRFARYASVYAVLRFQHNRFSITYPEDIMRTELDASGNLKTFASVTSIRKDCWIPNSISLHCPFPRLTLLMPYSFLEDSIENVCVNALYYESDDYRHACSRIERCNRYSYS